MEDADQINQPAASVSVADQTQQVPTPELVREQQSQSQHQVAYAGFWVRYAASIIDGFVFLIPTLILSVLLGFLLPKTGLFNNMGSLLIAVACWAADIYFVTKYGATPGKMFFGLKIVTADGKYPGIKNALLREILGKIISGLFLNLGYLWIVFDKQKQGFHDKIAGTYVLATRPLTGGRKILIFILVGLFPLAILGILAVAILVVLNPAGRQNLATGQQNLAAERQNIVKDQNIKNDIGEIATALQSYNSTKNTYPSLGNGLTSLAMTAGTGDLPLPSVPVPPTGGSYLYQVFPRGCAGTKESPCTSFAVSYKLIDPKVGGSVWCYQSKTGEAQELKAADCTP